MVSSTPRPHFTPGKEPVPILQEAGWAPGPVWTSGKSRPNRDSIPDRPASSQSLYRLSYQAHNLNEYQGYILGVGGRRTVRRIDNLTTFMCRLSENSGGLNLCSPQGSVQSYTQDVRSFQNCLIYFFFKTAKHN